MELSVQAQERVIREFLPQAGRISLLSTLQPLDTEALAGAERAVEQIMAAQRRILRKLLDSQGTETTMRLLGIPDYVAQRAAILEDVEAEIPLLRMDLLPTPEGRLWLCELNAGSSVGGGEAFEILRLSGGLPEGTPGPYELLARLVREHPAGPFERVLLADFAKWSDYGVFDLATLTTVLRAETGLPVESVDEDSALEVTAGDVVYRIFVAQDVPDDPDYVDTLYARAGHVISDFSGEILGSKAWLGLLQDPAHADTVGPEVLELVRQYVPATEVVDDTVLADLRTGEDREWFVKRATDFAGQGVVDLRQDPLPQDMAAWDQGLDTWIRQRPVEVATARFRQLDHSESFEAAYVLGDFRIGDGWSGCLVRCSASSSVVNAATGALVGWSEPHAR
ncbi:hypothetical protein [Kytococcus sedentarius]|uniref:hypothetical protein n=1 Tax=Kytococcus sedentarius TaxID=1276 RepID=UPI0035BBC39C